MELNEKVSFVFGAGKGVGAAFSGSFILAGAIVIEDSRNKENFFPKYLFDLVPKNATHRGNYVPNWLIGYNK